MKNSTKIVLGLGVAAIAISAYKDLSGRETNALANAHKAAGYDPACETLQTDGETWALCSIGRGAPAVWLQRGEAWATGNGVAQGVAKRLEERGPGPYQHLPRLYVDREQPVIMPALVRAKL
ncbi:hypothetical protein FA213_28815 [Pseudomonas aeruginosa]|uniref:hypothetical protein n=1 Tax=Pseudomonas aeruginosa TaxID=287 RepID=UPI000E317D27|nr:hypothetical protein [Pseudomonas aeruginosa]MCO3241179.1 hypothetical protein [Pseudomonas aeruginosa]MCO3247066.1 hypothetical protein [Pseudomonas aeruginosa]MCV0170171.1 hypothetical protein [Pseudomonas aeruginosa]MDI3665153.1 hypothetical protein [Pseudomonas aeruginosa]MDQ9110842.1 hypothetical protein [Pseudomonas aeruginosa]